MGKYGDNKNKFEQNGNNRNCENFGNIYVGCSFGNAVPVQQVQVRKKTPAKNRILSWVAAIIAVIADLVGIFTGLGTVLFNKAYTIAYENFPTSNLMALDAVSYFLAALITIAIFMIPFGLAANILHIAKKRKENEK